LEDGEMKYAPIYLDVFLIVYTVILRISFLVNVNENVADVRGVALKGSWVVLLLFIVAGVVALLFRKKIAISTWTVMISIVGFLSYIFLFHNIGIEP
jgi:hypothetical protein